MGIEIKASKFSFNAAAHEITERRSANIKTNINNEYSLNQHFNPDAASDLQRIEVYKAITRMGVVDRFLDWAFHRGSKAEALHVLADMLTHKNPDNRAEAFMWLLSNANDMGKNVLVSYLLKDSIETNYPKLLMSSWVPGFFENIDIGCEKIINNPELIKGMQILTFEDDNIRLSRVYIKLKEHDKAVERLELALKRLFKKIEYLESSPRKYVYLAKARELYRLIGDVRKDAGDFNNANKAFAKYMELNPDEETSKIYFYPAKVQGALRVFGLYQMPSAQELDKKYRSLQLKYHPDKNNGASGEQSQKVNQAKDILSIYLNNIKTGKEKRNSDPMFWEFNFV